MIWYLRCHQASRSIVGLVALGVIGFLWGTYELHLPSLSGNAEALIPVVLVIPLGCAVLIGAAMREWMYDIERVAAVNMRWARLLHGLFVILVAAIVLVPAMVQGAPGYGAAAALRNLVGYVGLAFLSLPVVGAALAWMLPTAYAIQVAVLASVIDRVPRSWGWPVSPSSAGPSWTVAVALCAAGFVAMTVFGVRRPRSAALDDQ